MFHELYNRGGLKIEVSMAEGPKTIRINGIRFSDEIFAMFEYQAEEGQLFRFVKRVDEGVRIETISALDGLNLDAVGGLVKVLERTERFLDDLVSMDKKADICSLLQKSFALGKPQQAHWRVKEALAALKPKEETDEK